MIAQSVRARTHGFPSGPMNSMWRSNRAPLRRFADPGPSDDSVALAGGAQIIDLVAHHDPMICVLVRRIGDAVPMRHRDLLDPLHPHRIVDVPELVDVLGSGGEGQLEDRARHFPSPASGRGQGEGLPLQRSSQARRIASSTASVCRRTSLFQKSHNFPAEAVQISGPLAIGVPVMLSTVGLDDDPALGTREVGNAAADSLLLLEPEAAEPTIA